MFLNVCKQTFHISHLRTTQKVKVFQCEIFNILFSYKGEDIGRFSISISNFNFSVPLKVTIEEKNWRPQNFDFLGLENLSPCQFCGALTHENIIEF